MTAQTSASFETTASRSPQDEVCGEPKGLILRRAGGQSQRMLRRGLPPPSPEHTLTLSLTKGEGLNLILRQPQQEVLR